MRNHSVVLTSDALVDLLCSNSEGNELGHAAERSAISAIAYADAGIRIGALLRDNDFFREVMRSLSIEIVPFDAEAAADCLPMAARDPGSRLGDQASVALAMREGIDLMAPDNELARLHPGCKLRFYARA